MTTTEVEQTAQEKQQVYLEMIEQFFEQATEWLPHSLETVRIEDDSIEDKTGEYQVPILSIVTKDQPAQRVANLLPAGISFLTDDAVLQIRGLDDEGEMIYMQEKNRVYIMKNGKKCPMYEGFVQDGWYLLTGLDKIRLVTKEVFIELLARVWGPQEEWLS